VPRRATVAAGEFTYLFINHFTKTRGDYMSSDLKRVSGLWLKQGRSGTFMSGETDAEIPAGTRLLVFKNTRKTKGDSQPDYILNVAPDDPGYESRGRQSGNGASRGSQQRQAPAHSQAESAPHAPPPPSEDEIPF
jgi:hypothetical protein